MSPFKKEGEESRYVEEILITAGDDINNCRKYMLDADIKADKYEYPAKTVIEYLLGRFKEEYSSEARLYADADKAEDPAVREKLMAKAKELEGKIEAVDQQLGAK